MIMEKLKQCYDLLWNFWTTYGDYVAIGCCVAIVVVMLINLMRNAYRPINTKLRRSCKFITRLNFATNEGKFVQSIPQPYQAQYKCYLHTEGLKASEVISFVPTKQKMWGKWILAIIALPIAFDTYYSIATNAHYTQYITTGVAVLLTYLTILFSMLKHVSNTKRAKRIFNRYIDILSAVKGKSVAQPALDTVSQSKVDNTVKAIQVLSNWQDMDQSMARVTDLLRDKALIGYRTVKQQRQINNALNALMLNMARRRASNSAVNHSVSPISNINVDKVNTVDSVETVPNTDTAPIMPNSVAPQPQA